MADLGHKMTDKKLSELEKKIQAEYKTAKDDVEKKYLDYMAKYEKELAKQKALLDSGQITQQEYNDFVYRKTMVGKRWEEMKDVLAKDYGNARQIALKMSKDAMPDVYALNANYATYQIEHDAGIDIGFTLYNHDTAEFLLGDQRQLMPRPSAKKAKEIASHPSMQWDKAKIQSAVLQGVLQGESPYKVAARLRGVGQMAENASIRYARTMTTSAQNAGRYESYRNAKKLGVDLTIEWQATLDNRTRHEHRMMHGMRTDVDKPFNTPDGYKIMYPADCTGDNYALQHLIWNCRCTLLAWVKGFEGDTVKESPKMKDMTFEEWQTAKAPKSQGKPTTETAEEPKPAQKEYKTMSADEYDEWVKKTAPVKTLPSYEWIEEGDDEYDPEIGAIWDDIGLSEGYYIRKADWSFDVNNYWRTGGQREYHGRWNDRLVTPENLAKQPKKLQEIHKELIKKVKKASGALDRMIDRYQTDREMVLDRWSGANALAQLGIDIGDSKMERFGHARITQGLDHQGIVDQINEKLIGATISDKGYTSASACSERNVFIGSDIKYTIIAPKGSNMYVTGNTDESEVILARDVELEVLGARVIESEASQKVWNVKGEKEYELRQTKSVEIIVRLVQKPRE